MLAVGEPFLVYVALPLAAIVATREILAHRYAILPYAGLQVVAGLLLFAVRRADSRLRAWIIVVYGVCLGGLGLVAFGPLLGIGVIFTWTVVAAAGLLGPRASLTTLGLSALAMIVVGTLNVRGLLPHRVPDFGRTEPWLRMTLTLLAAGAAIGMLTTRVMETLENALDEATEALTRERREREERERAQEALARSQRLDAVGRLAAGVAHDLNNALAVVLCNAESLRAGGSATDRDRLLADLVAAAHGAEETTRQLMVLGRKDTEPGRCCVPATIVERLARTVQRLLPSDVQLRVEVGSARAVGLSAGRLEQILLNLVLNARDALPRGGSIAVSVTEAGGSLVLAVADDGLGMPPEVRDRVFEPFFTTKEAGRGIGLGLSMVHGLVTEAGGAVDVTSSPGNGSTFTVRLPIVEPTPSVAPPAAAPARRARILVLEDEPFVLRAIQRVLRSAGHDVTTTADGASAAAALAEGPPFDLLFTDAVVPGTDTADVIAQFTERHPRAPVLVCSGYVREEVVRRGIRAGTFHFLQKPFEPDDVRSAVDAALSTAP